MKLLVTAILLVLSIKVFGEENADQKKTYVKAAGIPAINYSSDQGFGYGLVGSIYLHENDYTPYRAAFSGQAFFTTKNVHSHYFKVDWLRPFDAKMRLTTLLGFYKSQSETYCGKGAKAFCKDSSESYNFYRIMSGFFGAYSRWLIYQGDAKWEIMANYRGSYYDNNPYADSLYANDFKDKKKNDGYLSTLELGLMVDARDNEPAPTKGYWLETSIRGGSLFWGSGWDYIGLNAAARFYVPFDSQKKLVLANQNIFDGVMGDLPWPAIPNIGGSQSIDSYGAFGGKNIGRGIRDRLYAGKVKLISQLELRYTFLQFSLLKQDFDITSVLFADAGITSYDTKTLNELKNVFVGFGGGLRIHWNKNFIIRFDTAVSPEEKFSPKFYLMVGNVF